MLLVTPLWRFSPRYSLQRGDIFPGLLGDKYTRNPFQVLGLGGLKTMLVGSDYFWVVLCKNHRFHHKGNVSYAHQIVLGETDAYSPPPMLTQQFAVRCNACGAEYSYRPNDILRNEIAIPESFVPHPLFR
jgi:hypothetical protein